MSSMSLKRNLWCAEKFKKVARGLKDWEKELEAQKLSDKKLADQLSAQVSPILCLMTRLLCCLVQPVSAAACVMWGFSGA